MGTADGGNAALNAWDDLYWRRNTGIIGHDGKPRFYNSETGDWSRLAPEPLPEPVAKQDTAEG
jgi:hypothetical protein